MSINKIVIGISAGLILLTGVVYILFKKKQEKLAATYSQEVSVEQTWKLPKILKEISGIAFLEDDRIAAVQDERGTLFIYNLGTSKIEEQVEFARSGDFEGVAIVGATAYVLKSDGTLYKIEDFATSANTTEHKTPLTQEQDVEGLSYDSKNKRLLLAIKEKEPDSDSTKGIYAVDPKTMKMEKEPVFRLQLDDPVFEQVDEKKLYQKFLPSEVSVHPENGEIYMLEATTPKLLLLDSEGNPKKLYFLNNSDFPQPEGLTFDSSGNIYISNEGDPGTIHLVSIN